MEFVFGRHQWRFDGARVRIVGVVNVTPDSFSDGARYATAEAAVQQGEWLAEEGADAIDIGGESTRPGSLPVSLDDELDRVVPVVRSLVRSLRIPVSIDTTKAEVAEQALDEGATIVNDVTAGTGDPAMFGVVAKMRAGVVLMHMLGAPRTMQEAPRYEDVVKDVRGYLEARMAAAMDTGVGRDHIVIDPGIGFGKTLSHNLQLLRHLDSLAALGRPVLVGTSRKSFIGRITRQERPDERLEGTIASSLFAVAQGASLLRVHDVTAMRRALDVWQSIRESDDGGRG